MSKIYQSENSTNRYQEVDKGVSYNPVKAQSSEGDARAYGQAVLRDGETKRRELDREINQQQLTQKLTQNVETKALSNQIDRASAELEMEQKYQTNSLKQEHDHETRVMNLDRSELQAQGQVDSANLKAASTAVSSLLSFAGDAVKYGGQINEINQKKQEMEAENAAVWDVDGPDTYNIDTPSADIGSAQEDIAVESAIGSSTSDPQVQNAIRQDVTQPRIQHENIRRGNAYAGATDFGSFYNTWVNDPDVVYRRPDGSQFTAATARTRSDLAQINASAKRAFYKAANVGAMPAEQVQAVLNPVVRQITQSWMTTTGEKLVAANKAEAMRSAEVDAIGGLETGDNLSGVYQRLSSQLFASGGYDFDKGKAGEEAVKIMTEWAVRNNRPDVIDQLALVHKRYDANGKPIKGTQLGRQYEEIFTNAKDGVIDNQIDDIQRESKFAEAKVGEIIRERQMALANAETPAEETEINLATAAALREQNTPEALLKADQIEAEKNYSPYTFQQMKEAQMDGEVFTNEQLRMLVDSGDLKPEEAKKLGYDKDSSSSIDTQRQETLDKYKAEFKGQGTAAVTKALVDDGKALEADEKRLILQGQGVNVVNNISDVIRKELEAELVKNPTMDDASIREFIDKRGEALAKQVKFSRDAGLNFEYQVTTGTENVYVVRSPNDPTKRSLDLRSLSPSKLYYMPVDELDDNAILTSKELAIGQATYKTNGQYPQFLEDKAAALKTNVETLIRSQSKFYGVPMPTPTADPYLTPKTTSQVQKTSSSGSSSSGDLAQYDTGENIGGVQLDNLRNAVIAKESNGRMNAVNPDSGALGYGQVMPANVPSWSRQALGYSITPREFLRDPAKQMKIINYRFRKMMQDQSAAGFSGDMLIRRVASTWYSGRPGLYNNTRPQPYGGGVYPSIQSYTMDVVGRYRRG